MPRTITVVFGVVLSGLAFASSVAQSVTVNGTSCTVGSSCTVTAAPSGTGGGDLSGTYPNPTVSTVHATSGTVSGITINNSAIGGTTPAAGAFTTLSTTGQSIIGNAWRFYSGVTDGNATYTDFRTNSGTGNGIISAPSGSMFFNWDHGNNGVFFGNGNQSAFAVMTGSGKLVLGSPTGLASEPAGVNTLDSYGGIAVGAAYANAIAAPINGAIIQGSVGIGTTTPGAWSGVNIPNGTNVQIYGSAINARLIINSTVNDSAEFHLIDGAAASNQHNHRFYADNTGLVLDQPTDTYSSSTLNMFWANTGYVGIGTKAPAAPLEVNGGIKMSSNSAGLLTFADGTTQNTAYKGTATSLPSSIVSSSLSSVGTVTSGTWDASPLTSAYLPADVDYIDQAQTISGQKTFTSKVGIGDSSPNGTLDVVTTTDPTGNLTAFGSQHFVVGAGVASGSNSGGVFISYDRANNRGFIGSVSPGVVWRDLILQPIAGNVGIGTGFPVAPFQVGSGTAVQTVPGNQSSFAYNTFYDGSNWRYINSDVASALRMYGGNIAFNTVAAGTAGAIASAMDVTGRKMLLFSSGGLALGNNAIAGTDPGAGNLNVSGVIATETGVQFPDGTTQTTAYTGSLSGTSLPSSILTSSLTSVGTLTSGTWDASPLTSAYLPADVDYIDQAQTISGQKTFTSNVGIGTTVPQAVLNVHGNALNTGTGGIMLDASDNGNPSSPDYYLGINPFVIASGEVGYQFKTVSAAGGVTTPLTLSNGNVGIGTTTPSQPLVVVGNIQSALSTYLPNLNAATITSLGFSGPSGAQNWSLRGVYQYGTGVEANSTGGDLDLIKSWNGNTVLGTKSDGTALGNVGIGTVTPTSPLEVNGSIKIDSGGLIFPDGSSLSSASATTLSGSALPANIVRSSLTSVGTVTSGTWQGSPLTAAYLPTDLVYTDRTQTITGQTSFTSNLGIGTTTPAGALDVNGVGGMIVAGANLDPRGYSLAPLQNSGKLMVGWNRSAGGGEIDFISNRAGGANGGFNFYDYTNSGTLTPLVSMDGAGNLNVPGNITLALNSGASITFPDGTIQSTAYVGTTCPTGGDYAETVDVAGSRNAYEPGDVMVIGLESDSDVTKSSEPYSTRVAGIYSTKPGVVGRRQTTDPKTSTTEIPMAMVGIVPTKVSAENGSILHGDLLVTASIPGYAMKGTDRMKMLGAVVGKAMGSLSSGTGVIEVLVTLQ